MIVNNVSFTSFDQVFGVIDDQVKIAEAIYAGT